MNTDEYSHTQLGWVVFLSVVAAIIAILLIAFFAKELPVVAFRQLRLAPRTGSDSI
jgi:hypothetical protein